VLALAGIVGFFYSSDFGSPGDVEAVFGVLNVNGWENLAHILTGAVGLIAFSTDPSGVRGYALALGVFYVVAAGWGLIAGSGHPILGVVPVNAGENVLHAVLGLAGVAAALTTPKPESDSPEGA
jgi:Domain of unknown function (DUF4383)